MRVEICGDALAPSGYALHIRTITKALDKAGVLVSLNPCRYEPTRITLDAWWLKNLRRLTAACPPPDIILNIQTPEMYTKTSGIPSVGWTVWETDRIPDIWVDPLNRMQSIFTGTQYTKDSMNIAGCKTHIDIIPVPIDIEEIETNQSKGELSIVGITKDGIGNPIPKEERPFVFGCIAQWNFRKNIDDLVLGFCARFHSGEAVLLLKTYDRSPGHPSDINIIINRVTSLKQLISSDINSLPKVVVVHSNMTDEDIARLYLSIDCLVVPSRGEGFCIPAVVATMLNKPVVHTGYSAMVEYLQCPSLAVEYSLQPVFGMSASELYRTDQNWAHIGMNCMVETMLAVMADPLYASDEVEAASCGLRESVIPEVVASTVIEKLELVLSNS